MKEIKFVHKYQKKLRHIPLASWIVGGVIFGAIFVYSFLFFIPQSVQFSYAGETCVSRLILFPVAQKTSTSDDLAVYYDGVKSVGELPVYATKACFAPTKSPEVGEARVSISPYGGLFALTQFRVSVPEAPEPKLDTVLGREISTATPFVVSLTESDVVHEYSLSISDKAVDCSHDNAELSCDVSKLGLKQGTDYTVSLHRSFQGQDDATILEGPVKTLLPLKMTKGAISDGTVLYNIPTSFNFSFDQAIDTSNVVLKNAKGEVVDTTARIDETQLAVELTSELPRKSDFTLEIRQVIGRSGSSLQSPMTMKFSTSGGPKVVGVSIGGGGVSRNASILVTFDQPINDSVDVAAVARVVGASAYVAKQSPTELVFTLQNAPQCGAFTLVVDKGIKSGSNNETSESAWQYGSRTICGYSSVIGYSVQGRPIIAHYFGSGSTTILFTGAIHGSEPSSYYTMQSWATYLQTNGYKIPADKRVVIVPNVNPDGVASGSRNNANNVNLGRNFPTANWKADTETYSGTIENGGGTSPGSEPETKALIDLTRQLRPRLEVSFHAQGSLVGANKYADSVAIGDVYAGTVGYATMYYNAEAVMGYPMTGEYEDWMGEEMGIPAILIELPTHWGNYIDSQLDALWKMMLI
ncbi:murein peptide amidase A [Candidatus Saccharibacteria bacterium]|nr:murein peptide amidase A [Candidatus Saccharibacteria bacterium]